MSPAISPAGLLPLALPLAAIDQDRHRSAVKCSIAGQSGELFRPAGVSRSLALNRF